MNFPPPRTDRHARLLQFHRCSERVFGVDPELPRSFFDDDSDLINEDPVEAVIEFSLAELRRRRHRLVCREGYLEAKVQQAPGLFFAQGELSATKTALALFDREIDALEGRPAKVVAPALDPRTPDRLTWREWAIRLCGDTPAARASTTEDLRRFIAQRLGGEFEQALRVAAEMLDGGDLDGARRHLAEVLRG